MAARADDDVLTSEAVPPEEGFVERAARAFTESLFAWALGRDVNYADEEKLSAAVEASRADGFRIRSVVRAIVSGPSFLGR